jgi:hypothetical protein
MPNSGLSDLVPFIARRRRRRRRDINRVKEQIRNIGRFVLAIF